MAKKPQSVLRGSVLLMASALIAKVLGAVFRIPLTGMLGGEGMGYFSCAYGLFLPVLALSVTGMNTAVAAMAARLRAGGASEDAALLPKVAFRLFGTMGLLGSAGIFLLAGSLCTHLLHDSGAAAAVRCFAPAVFFCCMSAVLRGLHEGSCDMTPTAVSQVVEGIARVGFGLLLPAMLLRRSADGIEEAAAAAIFGITLSTAAGTLTLLCFPRERRRAAWDRTRADHLRRALLSLLLPVAAASTAASLPSLIDLAAGLRLLPCDAQTANFLYGAYAGLAVSVAALIPSVTNCFGRSALPAFASSFAQGDADAAADHAMTALRRTAFLALPAGMGLAVLAQPVLAVLFPARTEEAAAAVLPLAILALGVPISALVTPLFGMMQAAGFAGDTVSAMLCGACMKLVGNFLLIPRAGLAGAALATVLCDCLTLTLTCIAFRKRTEIRLPMCRLLLPSVCGAVLCAGTAYAVFAYAGHGGLLPMLGAAAAGAGVYFSAMALLSRCGKKHPEESIKISLPEP